VDRRAQTSIPRMVDGADVTVATRQVIYELSAAVRAAVVDEHDLYIGRDPRRNALGFGQQPRQVLDFVVDRIDEREIHDINCPVNPG